MKKKTKYNIAINGYGRIGRCVLRALYESRRYREAINIVAINELASLDAVYHLTKYDSTHGRFLLPVSRQADAIAIDGDRIKVYQQPDPAGLDWRRDQVDIVLECTGTYSDRATAEIHLQQGAQRLLFSQPASQEVDATVVYGVNDHLLQPDDRIISNASCTTNCIVPVLATLEENFGIESGAITTIHSAMHDQPVIDAYDKDLRKTRSALQSIIPVRTSLEKGIDRILPHLAGRFETLAIRVPTTNVSIMDLTVLLGRDTSRQEVNRVIRERANNGLRGVLGYTDEELVSCDFNHDSRSAIVDSSQTRVSGGRLLKVLSWFDNEWGFANRMLDTSIAAMEMAPVDAC
ncbi:MAG: glyceraldehyde 3-phosphate dehydrogenase NAD-binding domain-containing protein [Thermodesulfobacteriota bacterium]